MKIFFQSRKHYYLSNSSSESRILPQNPMGAAAPDLRLAGRHGLELGGRQGLGEEADLELDLAFGGLGDDAGDGDPDEELLGLDAGDVSDLAVGYLAGDPLLVVDEVGEVDVAGGGELNDEVAVGGEGVGLDGVGEEPAGEAVLREEVVDGLRSGGGEEAEDEKEEGCGAGG